MRGNHVREHFQLALEPREAEAMRRVLEEVRDDDQFPLNELEDEVLENVIDLLDPRAAASE